MGSYTWFCVINVAICFCACVCSPNDGITPLLDPLIVKETVDLSTYNEANKTTHVFLNYLNVSGDVDIKVVNATGAFFVIQFHSFKASFNLSNEAGESVTGKNTGLVQVDLKQGAEYNFYLRCNQELSENVKVLVAVIVYEREDPIPGGCNLTFKPEISPYQNVTYTDSMVQVDVQLASFYNGTCDKNPVETNMYYWYMSEQGFDEVEYFETITKVLTADDIMENAYIASKPDGVQTGRRYYSAYLGTGTVYAAVARYNGRISAYIPAVSYACDTDNWDLSCVAPTSVIWKILTALLLFVGTFSLLIGHAVFRLQSWITGFVVGFYIGYIVAGLITNISVGEAVFMGIGFGIVFTIIWTCFGCCCGLQILPPLLTVFAMYYIAYCICLYLFIGDSEFFRSNINYWGILIGLISLSACLFMVNPKVSHILACTFQGATIITFSVNYYMGSNLHYVFLENIRRLTSSGFNMAIVNPVIRGVDIALSLLWVFLFVVGSLGQIKFSPDNDPFMEYTHNGYEPLGAPKEVLWARRLRPYRGESGIRRYLIKN